MDPRACLLAGFLAGAALLPACSRRGAAAADPLWRAFAPDPSFPPGLGRIDWGADPLLRAGGVVLGREELEAYLCLRWAPEWVELRAFLRLREEEVPGGGPAAAEVIRARAALAGASGLDEAGLQRQLLARGRGQVWLLDVLRARLLAGLAPDRLYDDGLGRAVAAVVAGRVELTLGWGKTAPRCLARAGGRSLVSLEELLPDLLGAATEAARDRALREYAYLRVAQAALGGGEGAVFPAAVETPAEGWLDRLLAAFQAGPGREGAPAWLAEAMARAGRRRDLELLLVPALRPATGRPGTRADLARAEARARLLLERLRGGAALAALAGELAAEPAPGPVGDRLAEVAALSGTAPTAGCLSRLLGDGVAGLGLGGDPAWAILFAPRGEWCQVPSRWGPLLVRAGAAREAPAEDPGRVARDLRFHAWLRERVRGSGGSP